jgi:hypothetical protein
MLTQYVDWIERLTVEQMPNMSMPTDGIRWGI